MLRTFVLVSALGAALLFPSPARADDAEGVGKGPKRAHRVVKLLKRLDRNEDGVLQQAEVPARLWSRLARADADADGAVSKAELVEHRKARRAEARTIGAGEGDGVRRRGKGRRRGRRPGHRFEKHDANGDGALTADEVPAEVWKRISRADADGDGRVTKAELRAHAKQRRGSRGPGPR